MLVIQSYGAQFELALERFLGGRGFTFHGVSFWLAPDGHMEVSIQPSGFLAETTEQTALDDLGVAERVLNSLIEESPSFAEVIGGRPLHFVLAEPYGVATIEWCRLVNGSLVWSKGFLQMRGAA